MHPILIHIGWLTLPTYGLMMVIAILAAIYTVHLLGRREGLKADQIFDFSVWLVIVGLLGAKVLMIVSNWGYYKANPGQIFSKETFMAGGVFYGGFLASVLFAIWYVHVYKLPLWKVFDAYSPAISLGLGIGRIGCFAAGCDYGKPTSSFLGVTFTNPYSHDVTGVPLGVPLYPTQPLEFLVCVLIFASLLLLYKHKRYDGQVFVVYVVMYAVARFLMEFLRGDSDRGFVFNGLLSTSQFIAILAVAAAAVIFLKRRKHLLVSPPLPGQSPTLRGGRV